MPKQVAILGGGESGVGAAILAKKEGYQVFLSDSQAISARYRSVLHENDIAYEEGGHSPDRILAAQLVIKSPGIPDHVPLLVEVRDLGIPVVSEVEFASWYTSARLIAITGSNGKTTTSLLTYHLLKSAGLHVGLAGNVGDSFAWQVAQHQFDYYVLEVSSFQLDNIQKFRPHISVILNITPDHLDRYEHDFHKYVDSKFRITENQTTEDLLIYFADSEVLDSELQKRDLPVRTVAVSLETPIEQGGYWANDQLLSQIDGKSFTVPYGQLPIKGPHNAVNALVAITIGLQLGLDAESIHTALQTFVNAPHRLEPVAVIDGVTYINDSKATNVDSVYYALGSFDKPIILIAGGVDKGNDYSQIEPLVREKLKGLIVLSPHFEKLQSYFESMVPAFFVTQDLQEAIAKAAQWAEPEDVVLLSPACASFDLFKNYQDRGDRFKMAVRDYANSRKDLHL
ncbi:UDP-N-acetylmuramoylalanine--D-glutamate ligase [Dyadobacter jejuensis]|uniref:UDP-N-acetylmuramoylalanine--D-glutamate ligase n=1 Tax=Dyadobacter jejuensis TaxID=1082580 RepID=A0A316ARI9_9BACT|nr:UDP-N-acetylmuramoyl-L-alanine--D-glutamate ligase [Dyadobacter jejuensis]PWJ60138.1 UDP-N-acetylmuramoylalanine--D-glutamate ligase [Dyadobacter jejuensis]